MSFVIPGKRSLNHFPPGTSVLLFRDARLSEPPQDGTILDVVPEASAVKVKMGDGVELVSIRDPNIIGENEIRGLNGARYCGFYRRWKGLDEKDDDFD